MNPSRKEIIINKRKMSEHGATLQTYNQELVKCIEDLKVKRHEILKIIVIEESEKTTLEKNIDVLQSQLAHINSKLQQHKVLCENYERTIRQTEGGFKKILESSQALLNFAQHEATNLDNSNKSERYPTNDINY